MENLYYPGSNNKLDAILYENSSVYVTKSNSFEILNNENEKKMNLCENLENLFPNKARIKIISSFIEFKFYDPVNIFKLLNLNIKYSEISFHALNNQNNNVIIQLQLNEDIGELNKYDQLFIYHEDKSESNSNLLIYKVKEIFENILVGISLNPETQDQNNDIAYSGFDTSPINIEGNIGIEEDSNEYEDEECYGNTDDAMNQYNKDSDMNDGDDYRPYLYQNTVDKIFKTEKIPKRNNDIDLKRFDDAE